MAKGYCPNCGLEIEGDFTYCPNCGKLLPSFKEIAEETPPGPAPHRMELTDNIIVSLKYASLLSKDLGTLLILAALNAIPIINFLVTGYIYRVIRESPESEVLPPFQNFVRLWIDGLKLTLVAFLYMLVPSLLTAVAGAGLLLRFVQFTRSRPGGVAPRMVTAYFIEFLLKEITRFLPLLLGSLLLFFLISMILSMAVVHSAKTGSVLRAFYLGEVLGIIGRVGWVKYLVWLFVIFVLGMVLSAIGRIPFVGWLLLLLLSPPFYVFMARSAAQIYSEGQSDEVSP